MDFQGSMGGGLKKTSPHSEFQAGTIRQLHLLLPTATSYEPRERAGRPS